MDYVVHLLILVCIYLILAQGLNLTFGLGMLLNLAHIAVFAIGAYTTAILSTDLGGGFFVCMGASVALGAVFALLLGAISLKLAHDYFAVGTLAFSAIVTAFLINWKSLTRGVLGISGIPRPEILGIDFYQNTNFLILSFIFVCISQVILGVTFRSQLSRNLRAVAELPVAALALGKNIVQVRNISFIISSAFAALAGSLFAYYINYIDPSSFSLSEMIFVLSIVIVGKPGSFWGVNLAAVFLVLLPEPLRFLPLTPDVVGPMRQLLYALILFSVVYWKRATLFPIQRVV